MTVRNIGDKSLWLRPLGLLIVWMALPLHALSQNFLPNADFEIYSQCPDNLGQADRCISWFNVVHSVDYVNCTFDITIFYASNTGAHTGNGYMTLATYGNPPGSAEALGCQLLSPLQIGNFYEFIIHTKRPISAPANAICGGMCLYGFTSNPIALGSHFDVCTSNLAGATFLGCTPNVTDTSWQTMSFVFNATDAFTYIVISPECAPLCYQATFIDSVSIHSTPSTAIFQPQQDVSIMLYPNPAKDILNVQLANNIKTEELTYFISDLYGRQVFEGLVDNTSSRINISSLAAGMYVYSYGNKVGLKPGKIMFTKF